jgi:hypothetical protein
MAMGAGGWGALAGGVLGGLGGWFGGDEATSQAQQWGQQFLDPNNAPNIGTEGTGYGQYLDFLQNSAMGGFKNAGGVNYGGGMGGLQFMKKAGKEKFAPERTDYQNRVSRGEFLDVGSNPYVQDRADIMRKESTRAFDQNRGAAMSGMANAGGTMGMSGMSALASQNMVDRQQTTLDQNVSGFLGQQYQAERGLQQASEDTAERTRQTAIQGGAQVQGQKNIGGGMGAQAKASVIGARIRGMLGTGSVLGQGHQFNVNNALLPSEFALSYMNASAPYQGSPQGGWQGMLGGIGSGMAMGGGIGGKYFGGQGGSTGGTGSW